MPELPKPKRRTLKMELTEEEIGMQIARALVQIADGFQRIVETLDGLTTTNDRGELCLRIDRP
jgi:hypothetical protein